MTSAAETYRARLGEVFELIRKLNGSLYIHERRAKARPDDWGFAGDLTHLAERLKEITPNHLDRRCEWRHPKTTTYGCGHAATICTPDGRLLCGDHAIESDSDPRDCLDVTDGTPVDSD
jgi:hypothetical protein